MAGMRKEYDPNKAGRRKRRPIIYIICEGKETEIKYFKHFRSRNCLVDIVPISSKHKAAEHLVKHAKGSHNRSLFGCFLNRIIFQRTETNCGAFSIAMITRTPN